ncbi:MAG: hypothetical protein DI534_12855 [Leifsonia xyli]|nr:MAG: hypothetical protein DI534_12855 [Leifsonia xyli]
MTTTPSRRYAVATVLALLASLGLTSCAPADPLEAEIRGFSDLDEDGRRALADRAQADIDRVVSEAAGLDLLLGTELDTATAAVPRPEVPAPAADPDAPTPTRGASSGGNRERGLDSLAFSNGDRMLLSMLTNGFGASARDGGNASSEKEFPIDEEDPTAKRPMSFTVTDGRLVGSADSRAEHITESGVKLGAELGLQVDAVGCPAADGSVQAKVTFTSKVDIAAEKADLSAGGWGSFAWSATINGTVGDDAHLRNYEVSTTAEVTNGFRAASSEVNGRVGYHLASSWNYRGEASGGTSNRILPGTTPRIEASSAIADASMRNSFVATHARISNLLVLRVLDTAEFQWRSGACVRLGIAADADLPVVEKGSVVDLTVSPVAKGDNAPTGGTVSAERLDGAGTLEPMDAQAAPSTHRYRTPETDDTTRVEFTSTSKRGIGLLEQVFRTRIPAYEIDATINGIRTQGINCWGLAGEWTITSASFAGDYVATTVADVDPETLEGEYSIEGTVDVFPFTGGGLVEIERMPDGRMVMHLKPGETGYVGNGDFEIVESDRCNG